MSVFNFNSGKNMSAYPQIQSDLTATNLNLHCDPRTVGPTGTFLDMKSKAGKIAVEDDICDLTVNGKLTIKGQAEVCDIVCPEDFSVRAKEYVNMSMGNYFVVNAGNSQSSTTTAVTEGIGQRLIVDEQLFRIEPQEINIGKPTITGGNMTLMNGSCNSVGRLKGVSLQQPNFIQGIGTEKGGANTIQFTTGMPFGAPIVVLSYQGGILTGTAKPQITLVKTTNTNFEIDVTTSPVPAGVFLIPGVLLGNFTTPILNAQAGVYNCTTTSVGGTGAILKVTISAGGNVDSVEVLSSGGGYAQGDTVTVPAAQITGAAVPLDVTVNANELGTGLLEDMYINYQIIGLSELQ